MGHTIEALDSVDAASKVQRLKEDGAKLKAKVDVLEDIDIESI